MQTSADRDLAVNGVLAVGAAGVMALASGLLPSPDIAGPPLNLLLAGGAFQLAIAAAAVVILVVNARVLGHSPSLLWRAGPTGRFSGTAVAVALVALAVLVGYLGSTSAGGGRALSPWLLLAPVFALFNAVSEEVATRFTVYHAGDRLPASAKVVVSALIFGCIHYASGTPSGAVGFALSALLGAILMALTLAARTLRYAVLIHIALDVVIYLALIGEATHP